MRPVLGAFLIVVAVVATALAVWMVADGGFLTGLTAVVALLALAAWAGWVGSLRTAVEPLPLRSRASSQRGLQLVLIALAVAASMITVAALADSLFGGHVGGEVAIVWTITAVAGLFSIALWAAGLGISHSRRRRR